jgi:hypothetical protein
MERELRIVSDDGESILLADSSGNKYRAERKSAPHPTLISLSSASGGSELTIKEIQARLRAGQSPREISESTGTALEKIERFSGPIMHERNHIIAHALDTQFRRGKSELTLREVVHERLGARGVDINVLEWSAFRQEDGVSIPISELLPRAMKVRDGLAVMIARPKRKSARNFQRSFSLDQARPKNVLLERLKSLRA